MMASKIVHPTMRVLYGVSEYFPRKRVDILRTLRRVRPVIKGITRGVKSGKTNRSAAKRYTVTAKGRVIHAAQNRRHNMYHKGRKLVNSMGPDRELRGGQKQMALKLLNLK